MAPSQMRQPRHLEGQQLAVWAQLVTRGARPLPTFALQPEYSSNSAEGLVINTYINSPAPQGQGGALCCCASGSQADVDWGVQRWLRLHALDPAAMM